MLDCLGSSATKPVWLYGGGTVSILLRKNFLLDNYYFTNLHRRVLRVHC